MTSRISTQAVRAVLASRGSRAMRLADVVRRLGLPKTRRREVRELLHEMVDRGSVEQVSRHRFRWCGPETPRKGGATSPRARSRGFAELRGWISLHPRGFGFVTPEEGGPDVFVPASKLGAALHGDRVALRAWPSERGREGRITAVVERGVHRISGRLARRGRRAWLEPDDARIRFPVEVRGAWPLGIRPGDEVVAVIEDYPRRPGEGLRVRVLGGLGPRGRAAPEIERIEIREGVDETFPPGPTREAQAFGTRVARGDLHGREDLRHVDLVTIDPSDARDHDDAVHGERLAEGGYKILIAIADVSHYVQPGSALDRAAFARGTSIYLPDRVIPMLPLELSSHLASLVPGQSRLALCVEVVLGPRGAVRSHRYVEAVVRSRARLSYEGVARALGLAEALPLQREAEAHREMLRTLWDVSQLLRARRRQRGALELDLPETVVVLDPEGEPETLRRARTDPGLRRAYGLIEDLMLLANEIVAADLSRRGFPTIYRTHAAPDPERIARFTELAESLGHAVPPNVEHEPRALAGLLRSVSETPHAAALHYLLLRALPQATYATHNVGHFALAARSYLHFTSPIRRYPDLAVHRIVRALAQRQRLDREELARTLQKQAVQSSRLERRAQSIEREVTRVYGALLLRDRIGDGFEARISALDASGLWLTLDDPFVEARCPIESLGGDYALDPLGLWLVPRRSGQRFGLGDRLSVQLVSVSVRERSVIVQIEGQTPRTVRAPKPRRPGRHDRARKRHRSR